MEKVIEENDSPIVVDAIDQQILCPDAKDTCRLACLELALKKIKEGKGGDLVCENYKGNDKPFFVSSSPHGSSRIVTVPFFSLRFIIVLAIQNGCTLKRVVTSIVALKKK